MRYFIKFSYNGSNYHGWQFQPNANSVQETLSNAMSVVLKYKIDLMGAGRTDTGVHAKEMFAHFDFDTTIKVLITILKLNAFLPKDIVIFDIFLVKNDAHARFNATKRTYQYYINSYKDAFLNKQSYYYKNKLDLDLMNEAAKLLFNYTDFECFSKKNTDVNTHNCKIFEAHWTQNDNQLIFTITADRFLRNMVRAIVGTLITIGLKKLTLQDFETIIKSKDRNNAGFSVPACGLYLTQIEYDNII